MFRAQKVLVAVDFSETSDRAVATAVELASKFDGRIVLLHAYEIPALGFPDAPEAYAHLVAELARGDAHVAPLGELVTWRRARRALRARVDAGGERVMLIGGDASPPSDFTIRDADGRVDHGAQQR